MNPPPVPVTARKSRSWIIVVLTFLALIVAGGLGGLAALKVSGLGGLYRIPSNGMSSELIPGDHVFVEGISVKSGGLKRGTIVVFATDHISWLNQKADFTMRIVGLPGEKLRIADEKLHIDGEVVEIANSEGRLRYAAPAPVPSAKTLFTDVTIPEGHCYVLGDNTDNSLDSRYWGFVPLKDVIGRVRFRYWSPSRMGFVQ